jgi:uncharacterized protein (TIGR00251 family)
MLIRAKVHPNSSSARVTVKNKNSVEVHVKSPPREGAATREAILILAKHFKVPANRIRLRKGAKERSKIFELPD